MRQKSYRTLLVIGPNFQEYNFPDQQSVAFFFFLARITNVSSQVWTFSDSVRYLLGAGQWLVLALWLKTPYYEMVAEKAF
jgi:hypothetical protein